MCRSTGYGFCLSGSGTGSTNQRFCLEQGKLFATLTLEHGSGYVFAARNTLETNIVAVPTWDLLHIYSNSHFWIKELGWGNSQHCWIMVGNTGISLEHLPPAWREKTQIAHGLPFQSFARPCCATSALQSWVAKTGNEAVGRKTTTRQQCHRFISLVTGIFSTFKQDIVLQCLPAVVDSWQNSNHFRRRSTDRSVDISTDSRLTGG